MRFSFRPLVKHADAVGFAMSILLCAGYIARRLLWLTTLQPGYAGYVADFCMLVVASTVMLVIASIDVDQRFHCARTILCGALMGVIIFVATLGFGLADPTRIDWLLRGDWAQHFLGWQFFRQAAWTLPPGAFDTWLYPVDTSVMYTDSLPLLALPLKVLSPWLPDHFQYIGFWFLFNCVMHGVFGALLVSCFSRSVRVQTIGAGIVLLAPVFLARLPHDTLTTQWLILAGLWMYFRSPAPHASRGWLVIAAVTALVHPYLSAMVLTLMLAFYVAAVRYRALPWRAAGMYVASATAITLVCWWIAGVFILKIRSGFEPAVYSANLLTWFDSEAWSRWLPALPHSGVGQYEGFGYLGAGVFVLVISACLLVLKRASKPAIFSVPLGPLIIATLALSAFAFSTRLTLGDITLFDITPKHLTLLGAFRCSGRFIWVSVYVITILGIGTVARRGGRFAVPLLGAAFIVQLVDLSPLHVSEARMRVNQFSSKAETSLQDSRWNALVAGRSHIQLVPAAGCGEEAAPYFPFSMLAADHGMSVNTAYLARMDGLRWEAYCADAQRALDAGDRDRFTLYIINPALLDHFKNSSKSGLDCQHIEGYDACIVADAAPTSIAEFDPVFDCYRVNYAWGFSLNGVAVGRDGRILRYTSRERDSRGDPQKEAGRLFYDRKKLLSVYTQSSALGSVDPATLADNVKLIAAVNGDVSRRETGARDAGSSTCHAYIPEAGGARYADVPLGSDGGASDYRIVNASLAAAALIAWLQSIGVASK